MSAHNESHACMSAEIARLQRELNKAQNNNHSCIAEIVTLRKAGKSLCDSLTDVMAWALDDYYAKNDHDGILANAREALTRAKEVGLG